MSETPVNLNYVIAKRAMSLIAQQASMGMLDNIGLSEQDWKKVNADVPWIGSDRNRVTVSLNTLLSGVLDAAGVPRFALPAEYIAAGIAMYVSPINIQLACAYVERPRSIQSLAGNQNEFDTCTAAQLYALIVSFHGSTEHDHARRLFEKNTKLKLEQLADKEKEEENVKNSKKN